MKRFGLVALLIAALTAIGTYSYMSVAQDKHGHGENMVSWFEIPVADMARAQAFYEGIFQFKMRFNAEPEMAFFPGEGEAVTGALIKQEGMKASADGSIVYLNGGHDLQPILDRVVAHGGAVVLPKTEIPDVGFFALFLDSEGNRLGLFSMH